jgi:NADH-quinone oxidoreductase subunit N
MPLLAGFWGKFFVFYSAVSARLLWLALIGLAGSVISFGYYGRTIRSMYFDDAAQSDDIAAAEEGESARSAVWPAAMGAAIIVFTGVAPLVWSLSLVYALFQLQ